MISDDLIAQNQHRTFRMLGAYWLIYGVLRLIAAVWVVFFSNTATVMFGALLARIPAPFTMMSVFHLFYILALVLLVLGGALGILAGWALLAGQKSGQILALIAGFLSLSEIPMGLTLGTYSIIVLLPLRETHASTDVLDDRTSDLRGHPSAT